MKTIWMNLDEFLIFQNKSSTYVSSVLYREKEKKKEREGEALEIKDDEWS